MAAKIAAAEAASAVCTQRVPSPYKIFSLIWHRCARYFACKFWLHVLHTLCVNAEQVEVLRGSHLAKLRAVWEDFVAARPESGYVALE